MEDGGWGTAGWRRDRHAPGRPPPPPSQRTGEGQHGDTHARGHLVPVPGLLSPPRAPASCLAPAGCAPTAPALRGDRMSLPEPQHCSSQPEKPPIISCQYSRGFFCPSSSQPQTCSRHRAAPQPQHLTWGSLHHPNLQTPLTPSTRWAAGRDFCAGLTGSRRDLGHSQAPSPAQGTTYEWPQSSRALCSSVRDFSCGAG